MRIVAFHLLNDFSGSPKVLRQLLSGWVKEGMEVHLFTAGGKEGFLSDVKGVQNHPFWYRWHGNAFIRLFTYSLSQCILFLLAFKRLKKGDVVYINTVLPFGAAVAGKLKGCRIIYHLHETTVNPPILKKFLFGMVKWAGSEVICVSMYMADVLNLKGMKIHIIPNALESRFLAQVIQKQPDSDPKNVLMICSLKWYKGVFEFIELARLLSFYQFRLVLNASKVEVDQAFNEISLPGNLEIYPAQFNVHPHYQWADLVLNLSRPDGWVETFGLTVIEAMAYHLPVVVPPVGGISELVEEGKNGFKVDSRNLSELSTVVLHIFQKRGLYTELQHHAELKVARFNEAEFIRKSLSVLKSGLE